MRRVVAVLVLVAALLCACAKPPINGYVIDKDFTAAHSTTVMLPQYITTCSGNPPVCSTRLSHFLPVTTHHPDTWRLKVQEANSDRTKWVVVVQGVYDETQTGDYFEEGSK